VHRLRPAGGEIDDGEPALAERRPAFRLDPDAAAVGTAMAQRIVHGFADRAQRVGAGRRPPIDQTCNTAHRVSRGNRRNPPCRCSGISLKSPYVLLD
jgi:hypothetical protein